MASINIVIWLPHGEVPCWNFSNSNREHLQKLLPEAKITVCADKAELLKNIPDADVACVWYFEQGWFEQAKKLKILSTPAAGRDYFRVELPSGVQLWNGTFHGEIIGETVAAYVLAECRGVTLCERLRKSDPWPIRATGLHLRATRGQHAVILGFGAIGQWIGRYLKPFGMRITGIRRHPGVAPDYFTEEDNILPVEKLHEVLPAADHVILALPSDTGTDDIIGAQELGLMPPHSVLYNIGRGNAIDEDALCEALCSGKISGAYLDVFKVEPLPDSSPLRKSPNLFIMPHASAISPNYLDLYADELARRLLAEDI